MMNKKARYHHDGEWYDAEVLDPACWVNESAYWIMYVDDNGTRRTVIADESDLVWIGENGPNCTCGISASGGGFHSSWCDRYLAGIKIN